MIWNFALILVCQPHLEFLVRAILDHIAVDFYPTSTNSQKVKQYVLYDLQTDSVRWAASGNPHVNVLTDNLLVLDYGSSRKLYNAMDGQFIRDIEKDLLVFGGNAAMFLNKISLHLLA